MRKVILTIMWIIIIAIVPVVTFKYEEISYSNNVPYIFSTLGIEVMDITIDVNKDNSIDVSEIMTFNLVDGIPFDGITMNLPSKENLYFNNRNYKRNIKVKDISSEDISVDTKKGFNNIEAYLGKNTEGMSSGLYTYSIKYHYDLGNNNDDFIYRVFSNVYNVDIFNMGLTINFEDKIDKEKVKFYSNNNDVTNRMTFGVEDNTIRASLNDFIVKKDLIVDVGLDNYFTNQKSNNGFIAIIMLITITLLTLGLLVLNIINHRKKNDLKELYVFDIRSIITLLVLILIEVFGYLFLNDLLISLTYFYYIVYGIIALVGLVLIRRLKLN